MQVPRDTGVIYAGDGDQYEGIDISGLTLIESVNGPGGRQRPDPRRRPRPPWPGAGGQRFGSGRAPGAHL